MSSRSSYSSYSSTPPKPKGATNTTQATSRSSTSSTRPSTSSTRSSQSSLYAHSSMSARNYRYGSKPGGTVIHNGGGAIKDPNTSTSASDASYYP